MPGKQKKEKKLESMFKHFMVVSVGLKKHAPIVTVK